ncbi:hypothetical protein E2C01_033037 [Portunus trituberculatus]|uniref:Uncharacterized protein n=1 Tax=Portunus trituberculatus TaxID=210409 RepID=A0A5B7F2P4_PORTR|nr:hypothetical protein [Portunus trituberculatus]
MTSRDNPTVAGQGYCGSSWQGKSLCGVWQGGERARSAGWLAGDEGCCRLSISESGIIQVKLSPVTPLFPSRTSSSQPPFVLQRPPTPSSGHHPQENKSNVKY